ncbi:amino acid adenylation domain-containing protein, partial [Methanobrevibacter sp.]|uniref:amino acid adenylation domain-containing protein n=1 Tax=Methanobrevibacter sp. TaxID=66852 RepID=UPI00388F10FC
DSVLLDDDFIQLGGNSLSLMKLQLILNERLGIHLSSAQIMELRTPIKISDYIKYNLEVHSPIEMNYSFDDCCPLSESQLNVYLDESVNDMGTAYNNPFKIEFKDSYSADDIKNAVYKLLEIYPVLSARVVNEDEALYFSFDGDVEVSQGLENDISSFIRPFDFEKSLSRFLIAEDEKSISLCMDCHHLIFDGTSANILLDSLLSILEGNDIDSIDTGILREISYEENISSDYMEEASLFFDSMLEDVDEVYELLPSVKTEESSDFEYIDIFDIDKNHLSSFLEKASITHNQFFTSAFAYALSKFTASSKVLFNLIEDGRGHIDLSESVGMFVRTLPLVIDCKNQDTLSFLDYSSGIISYAMKYDLYPFRLLANEYDLNSDILFQYSHDLLNSLMTEEGLPYKVEDLKQDLIGDLSFFVFNEDGDKLGIKILYSQKFSNDFIKSFAKSYELILKEMMYVDDLSDINYVSSSDLDILDSYNQNEKDLDYDDILDAFNDHLLRYPNNPLVSYNDVSYSYAEGAFIAEGIANSLKDMGVSPQDNVAFFLERSELYMFSALAILSIGAVYVPIDDALPDERIRFMLNDTDAKAVIVSKSTYERAKNLIGDEEILLDISEIVEDSGASLSSLPVVYGDLACILYTSGTTGIPKGVKITRKGITSYVDFYVNEYNMKNGSKFGMFSSIGFDVGAIRAICGPLYGGSCLDIVPMDIRLNIEKLNQHFISHGVSHTTLPTQVARIFIEEVKDTTLKVLITGGEKLGQVNASPDYSFIDSYGPTEACVAVCAIEEKDKMDSSSIGHLFTNLKVYVLDDELRRVPIGAVGELHIAGNQVAKGYLNRNEETTKAFIDNPFERDEAYGIMYRTGDLVRVLPDGSLGIVGRRDSQVKVRGNRVELMEVEAAIREMDSIEAVTVQAIEHNGNNELVAYVVSDDENIKESLLSYIASQKPDYMVPSFVVELDNIPLTVNGKVDRNALPEVDRSALHAGYIAPRDEKERTIVKAFENVFNQENIGIQDDFIHLGGDSLISIKLLSHLEDYDITAADILSLRTPEAIAKSIDEFSLDLDIYSLEGGCPLNEAQINLFLDSIMNKTDFYHIPTFMNIPKEYGLQKVLDALDEILIAHPILAMRVSDYYEGDEDKNFFDRIRDNVDLLKDLKDLGDSFSDQSLVDLLKSNGWNIKSIWDMVRTAAKAFRGEYPYLVRGAKPPVTVESGFNEGIVKNFLAQGFDLYDYLAMFKVLELEDSYVVLAKFNHIIFDGMCVNTFKRD